MASTNPEVIRAARRFTRIVNIASVTPLASLIGYVCYVKWKLHKSTHRGFTPDDMYYIRTMNGSTIPIMDNPGIRIEPNFLNEEEQEKLRFETKMMLSLYGYSTIAFWARPNWNKQIAGLLSKTRVNAIKVSGRDTASAVHQPEMTEHARELKKEQEDALIKTKPYETNEPNRAPWGSARSFDWDKLPKTYQDLVNKIRNMSGINHVYSKSGNCWIFQRFIFVIFVSKQIINWEMSEILVLITEMIDISSLIHILLLV